MTHKRLFLKILQLKSMKLFFKLFILVVVTVFSISSLAKEYNVEYNIKVRGLEIGLLFWYLELDLDKYTTIIRLNDRGIFSGLYKFQGEYKVKGKIKNAIFSPEEYSQTWKTKRKKKEVNIFFENNKISKLILRPKEKEVARIDYYNIVNYTDPLSSFLNILMNNSPSKTIDGRRTYTLNPSNNQKQNKILITNYNNIWADHKRNDLEYIEIYKHSEVSLLPPKVKIKFKDILFELTKN